MKSILVLDNDPYDCTKCQLNAHTDYDFDVCWIDKRSQGVCPLKRMPEKKPVDVYRGSVADIENYGWNACLEEIEKC